MSSASSLKAREAWLKAGTDAGWVSEPYCMAHDTGRLHPAHAAELRAEGADDDDLLDVCSSVVTLTPSDYLGTGPWPDA